MAVGAAAAVIGAIGGIAQGFMGYQSGQYQAQVAKNNEKIAKQNADSAIVRSQIDQEDSDTQTSALLGEQESAQAASGLSLSGKSAIRTRASARRLGRMDALRIIDAGRIDAQNFKVQAMNFRSEAQAAKMSGRNALIGGFFNAASSVVGAAQQGGGWDSLMSNGSPTGKAIPRPVAKPVGLVY